MYKVLFQALCWSLAQSLFTFIRSLHQEYSENAQVPHTAFPRGNTEVLPSALGRLSRVRAALKEPAFYSVAALVKSKMSI